MRGVAAFTAGILSVLAAFAACAEAAYPDRPVRIVVPYGAGTQTDVNARYVASRLESLLKQPFVVDNRPGADGIVGSAVVSKSTPDGYTLLMTTNTTHAAVRALYKSVPYDPIADFTPVATLERFTSVLAASPQLPAATVQDLVALARAQPDTLSYGYANVTGQIAGETLKRRAGVKITAVPYTSTTQGMNDLAGGRIQLMATGLNTAVSMASAGLTRILAVFSKERSSILPDVPTLNETEAPGFSLSAWFGVFAPAHTPNAIVDQLASALRTIMGEPAMAERLKREGLEPFFTGPADFRTFLTADTENWRKLVTDAGIEPR